MSPGGIRMPACRAPITVPPPRMGAVLGFSTVLQPFTQDATTLPPMTERPWAYGEALTESIP